MSSKDKLICKHFFHAYQEIALSLNNAISPVPISIDKPLEIPIEKLQAKTFSDLSDSIYLLRLDKVNFQVKGNKVFKLLPNLYEAQKQALPRIVSFGGNYSNHIHALADLCHNVIPCTVLVRGERAEQLTSTLQYAQDKGVQLHFVSRRDYQQLQNKNAYPHIQQLLGLSLIVPVGGSNLAGLQGMQLLGKDIMVNAFLHNFNKCFVACGTGGTLAALAAGISSFQAQKPTQNQQLIGINVVNQVGLDKQINDYLCQLRTRSQDWQINHDYHFGAYAKFNNELQTFIHQLEQDMGEIVDHVYMGKVFYAVYDQLKKALITPNEKIVIIHSGGQQGAMH